MPFKADNYSEPGSAWHHVTKFLSASYLHFPSASNPYFIFRSELVDEGVTPNHGRSELRDSVKDLYLKM